MHAKKKKTDINEEEDEQKYHVNFVLRFRTSFFLVFFFSSDGMRLPSSTQSNCVLCQNSHMVQGLSNNTGLVYIREKRPRDET